MSSLPRHRTVADLMTSRVHVANPYTPFKVLVRLIEENRVSAVPIVDQHGMPVGVVSESDLLLKERRAELESKASPLRLWRPRQEMDKAEGLVASELMSSPAITVGLATTISEAARLMQERNIRRLVVVDARGRIAGIVSRSDLLQVFLRTDDVITLSGEVDRRSDAEILARLARDVDGVVDVVNMLTFRWDDVRQHARAI